MFDESAASSKFCDNFVAFKHAHIVDSASSVRVSFLGVGSEHRAEFDWFDEVDIRTRCDGCSIFWGICIVAGNREGGVSQREEKTAVHDAETVEHILGDGDL